MTIKSWPAAERPRERLLGRGASTLGDAELLAILLRTGLPGGTAVDRVVRPHLAPHGIRDEPLEAHLVQQDRVDRRRAAGPHRVSRRNEVREDATAERKRRRRGKRGREHAEIVRLTRAGAASPDPSSSPSP